MNSSVLLTALLPGLLLASALMCVCGGPAPARPRDHWDHWDHMPQGCEPTDTYCTYKSTDYPQSLIDNILKQYKITVSGSSTEPTDNRVSYGSSECEPTSSHDYSQMYYIRAGRKVHVVVQSDPYLVQQVRLARCKNDTAFVSSHTQEYTTRCVQRTLNYSFVVLSEDGTALDMVAVELPVHCARLAP